MSRIPCFQSKSCQRIRNNIRGTCQIFSGSCCQVHNTGYTSGHLFWFPPGHCHVIKRLGCLCRCELGRCSHFLGFCCQVLKRLPCCSGNGSDLAHHAFKVFVSVYRIAQAYTDTQCSTRLCQWVLCSVHYCRQRCCCCIHNAHCCRPDAAVPGCCFIPHVINNRACVVVCSQLRGSGTSGKILNSILRGSYDRSGVIIRPQLCCGARTVQHFRGVLRCSYCLGGVVVCC